MRARVIIVAVVVVLLGAALVAGELWLGKRARIREVSPRLASNQTSQPLALFGDGFEPGMTLSVRGAVSAKLPLSVLDSHHAFARLPPTALPAAESQTELLLSVGPLSNPVHLTYINDQAFPELRALAASPDGRFAFAASTTEDRLYVVDLQAPDQKPAEVPTRDGPIALAVLQRPDGPRLWVGHQFETRLSVFRIGPQGLTPERDVPGPDHVGALAADPRRGQLLVADQLHDQVVALDADSGQPRWSSPVDPNPGSLAVFGDEVWVGSLQTGVAQVLDARTGELRARVMPHPGTPIVGGHTERYSQQIMGGSAPRSLAAVPELGVVAADIGPNIGPNADRMEVSMNGGVTAFISSSAVVEPNAQPDGAKRRTHGPPTSPQPPTPSPDEAGTQRSAGRARAHTVLRHLGFDAGVPSAVLVDAKTHRLFVADPALGVIRVLDAQKLFGSEEDAKTALLQTVSIPPPARFPLFRKASDFGVNHRAGVEIHSGPFALTLAGDKLLALNRFSGTLAVLATGGEAAPGGTMLASASPDRGASGALTLERQIPVVDTLGQKKRRLGEILYFADLGQTAMSCEACHLEGHTGGVLFAKTHPLRIYRSPTIRAARESPPYFIPASTFSLAQTAHVVGNRNRYQSPQLTDEEIEDLALFTVNIPTLPNPFRDESGALLPTLLLPDGRKGDPRLGAALFEGKAGCAGCHPAPHFTTDQDPNTRGKTYDVGTPHLMPLREGLQEKTFVGFPAPSLLGSWDLFPMLTSATVGLAPAEDGTLQVQTRFPLRELLSDKAKQFPQHGHAAELTPQEQDDLIAYVMSL